MKKILILIGPLFSYVICLVTGGFHLIVQFSSTVSVTAFFFLQCIGFVLIGIMIPIVSKTILHEKNNALTKIFCCTDILLPLAVWFICLKTGNIFAFAGSFTLIYFIYLGIIAYSCLAREQTLSQTNSLPFIGPSLTFIKKTH